MSVEKEQKPGEQCGREVTAGLVSPESVIDLLVGLRSGSPKSPRSKPTHRRNSSAPLVLSSRASHPMGDNELCPPSPSERVVNRQLLQISFADTLRRKLREEDRASVGAVKKAMNWRLDQQLVESMRARSVSRPSSSLSPTSLLALQRKPRENFCKHHHHPLSNGCVWRRPAPTPPP